MSSELRVDKIIPTGGIPTGGGGGVIQVVSFTTQTKTTINSGTTFVDTGVTATITPKFATSKILILAYHSVTFSNFAGNGDTGGWSLRLLRGSTAIAVGDSAGSRPLAFAQTRVNDTNASLASSVNFLDSPNTTSATTYKVQMMSQSGTVAINRTNADSDSSVIGRTISSITVMEVRG